jgi:hypothetical protein
MKIENGKWVDQYGERIDNFNIAELVDIGEKVETIYGEDITYDRISIISSIRNLTRKQESDVAYLLEQEGLLNKLAGY